MEETPLQVSLRGSWQAKLWRSLTPNSDGESKKGDPQTKLNIESEEKKTPKIQFTKQSTTKNKNKKNITTQFVEHQNNFKQFKINHNYLFQKKKIANAFTHPFTKKSRLN